jgi:uncharacterized membrane protein
MIPLEFRQIHSIQGVIMAEELKRRSLIKAISWRATGTLDTMLISFIVTGNFTAALSIGAFELITKTALYYFHERAWNRISFGKSKAPEYTI